MNIVKSKENVQVRQQTPYPIESNPFYANIGSANGYPYPGIENPFDTGGRAGLPVPYSPPQMPTTIGGGGGTIGGGGGSSGGGGLLGNFNLGQVKGFVDKMGGIEGIVGTMTRVQKMVSSFQQMAPMLKLLMGSFGKASAKSLKDGGGYSRRKRRSKSRKNGGKRPLKKYGARTGRTGSTTGKKRR